MQLQALAIISNFGPSEFILILVVAILIFGRRLPEVAARAAVYFQRLRRGITDLRREAGFDEELRKARQVIEDPMRAAYREINEDSVTPASPKITSHPSALSFDLDEPDQEGLAKSQGSREATDD